MLPITLSPAATYATKKNLRHPGPAAKVTADAAAAIVRIEDLLDTTPSGTSTVSGITPVIVNP